MYKTIRLGETNISNQGCLMKIIKYNNAKDIIVEFQDKYKTKVHTSYRHFAEGNVKNPYCPSVCNVGIIGIKYPTSMNGKMMKEYKIWKAMLKRSFDGEYKKRKPTYENVTCCDEWLNYENFYEWLHSQENFEKWLNGNNWAIDKDILFKGNKIYSPNTCCLVPQNINQIFVKRESTRGSLPIGVSKKYKGFVSQCMNPFTNQTEYLGYFSIVEEAFQVYKQYKEYLIKKVAQIEYDNGNITEECYSAMMKYQVEITD